jgi:predicted acyl esterase
MKNLLLVICFFIWSGLEAQNADSAWFVNNYTKKEVYITMRDGVRLFTSVFMPKDTTEPHPILMERTPYSCAPYGEGLLPWGTRNIITLIISKRVIFW